MEIDFLRHFNFPADLLSSLRTEYGDNLLPLQKRVIQEGRLFEGKNLLICAPTSSGKTFLAEILFLYHTLQGRNVILLVPSKALAHQRYQQWKERYQPFGYDIRLSTRDHPFHDRQIQEGRFHLAIVIYEKMRALLANNSAFLASLGACIVDEIQYLYNSERGAELEILLTKLRRDERLQILGLSAMVSDPQTAEWLRARPIVESERPVDLRQGVLCQGRFSYREFNSGLEGVEEFYSSDTGDEGEAMLEAARFFVGRGETTLLFWPQRSLCYTAARKLSRLYKPETILQIPGLDNLEPTGMRDFLGQLLPLRIAVHTSDLTLEERRLVESWVRAGEVMLICATSTLAEGINLPVTNVLTTRRMYAVRTSESPRSLPPAALPISRERLWNMIGRAGRLGLREYGRGIVVTASPGDVEGLLALYMRSESSPVVPVLHQIPFSQILLKTMGYAGSFTTESCRRILDETLSGRLNLLPSSLDERIQENCTRLTAQGYLTEELGVYYPTPLGGLIMKNGLSEPSAQRLSLYLHSMSENDVSVWDDLYTICMTRELEEIYLPVSRNEIRSHTWSMAFARAAEETGWGIESSVKKQFANPERIRPEHHVAFKKALLLRDWMQGFPILELEKRYGVYSGQIVHLGEEASWVFNCLLEAASALAQSADRIKQLTSRREQVLYGLPASGLAWQAFLRKRILSRSQVLDLLHSGFECPAALQREDKERICSILTTDRAETFRQMIPDGAERDKNECIEPFLLELSETRPDRVLVNGVSIRLTPLHARLLHALARRNGSCVFYEEIMKEMWPDSIGDRKYLLRHKIFLLQKIGNKVKKPVKNLIESIPGTGLVLNAQVRRNK